jgi:hypothetical protein
MTANATESLVGHHLPCCCVIANGTGPPIPSSALKVKEHRVILERFQRKAAKICDEIEGNRNASCIALHEDCVALHKKWLTSRLGTLSYPPCCAAQKRVEWRCQGDYGIHA